MRQLQKRALISLVTVLILGAVIWSFTAPHPVDQSAQLLATPEAIARGEYLVTAGGCVSCHLAVNDDGSTDTSVLSGGHALTSEFGTFYVPNITPDKETGLGNWDAQDFLIALKQGRSPDGSFYYPAFPYRSYAGLSDEDALDIAAYLMSLEPIEKTVPEHETAWWLNRFALVGWNLLFDFFGGELPAVEVDGLEKDEQDLLARGAYLARNLGHCGECHTPRNGLGIPKLTDEFSGATLGDEVIEAIDPEALAEWTRDSFDLFLILGMKPDAEFVGGDMNDVIEHNTSRLSDEDRLALAAFFTR